MYLYLTAVRDFDGTYGPRARLHEAKYREKIAKHPMDGGFDLYGQAIERTRAFQVEGGTYSSGVIEIVVGTGIRMYPPPGTVGRIENRSSTPMKAFGATVFHSIIDAGYSGHWEIRFLTTTSDTAMVYRAINNAIAQEAALAQVVFYDIATDIRFGEWDQDLVDRLGRGDNGFGSTDLTSDRSTAKVSG